MIIPAFAFIIIGAIVTAVSFFAKMTLFIFVGIAFIVYGGFRLFKKSPQKPVQHHCPRCRTSIQAHQNYCSNCGTALKYQRSHPHFHSRSYYQHHYGHNNQVRRVP